MIPNGKIMISRPQIIPKIDRKWSSTVSDPQSRPQMIPWKIEEWNGMDFMGLSTKKDWLEKGKEDARSLPNLYKSKKKKTE